MLVASAGLVAACGTVTGGGTPEPSGTATLFGQVLAGPQCPVEQEGVPCPPAPVKGALVEALQDGRMVTSVETGVDGRWRLMVAPGSWTVRTQAPEGLPSTAEQSVTVRAGDRRDVPLLLDTGIR